MNRGIFGLMWAAGVAFLFTATGCSQATGADGGPVATCSTSADCGGAQYCAGGFCLSKVLVGTCSDSSQHKGTEVCASGLCLGGGCCNSPCPAAVSACQATACDANTGSCKYPAASVSCGPPETCANGSHTGASSCDGHGACALAAPKACDSLACSADNKTCLPGCHDSSSCGSGYCAWGQCVPKLAAGATCGATTTSPAGAACNGPGLCLGTFCCASACNTTDLQCGSTSCDSSGACIYPDQRTSCGALQACGGETYTPPSSCNGQGTCTVSSPTSCEPYVCNHPQSVCWATCTADGGQCAVDGYCGTQKCALKGGAGVPCSASPTNDANSACTSGICSGNCCVVLCPADPTTYNCVGLCDTAGACLPHTCPNNFGCSGTATCNTACATNFDCNVAASYCDTAGASACCTKFKKGDTIYVDGVNGSDDNVCCGSTAATACLTLTHAMALVSASATSGVILQVSNGDGSSGWNPKGEAYPIHLGWGVTLNAQGLYFTNPAKASDIFQVYAYDKVADTGTVTIQGGSSGVTTDGVWIGWNPNLQNTNYTAAYQHSKIAVNAGVGGKTGVPLVLSEVWLRAYDGANGTALNVGPGVNVTLGPNPVEIGNGDYIGHHYDYTLYSQSGLKGINCKGAAGSPATIKDDTTATSNVLTMDGWKNNYMDIEDYCTVSLTMGPQFGYSTGTNKWDGTLSGCLNTGCGSYCSCYKSCQYPYPGYNGNSANPSAVRVVGNASLTFGSSTMPASIGCAQYFGIDQETSDASGSPTVTLTNTTIDMLYYNNVYSYPWGSGGYGYGYTCADALVGEGTFTATSSTFAHSLMGVYVGANAVKVDLSGGGNGGNTFDCNNRQWSGYSTYYCGTNYQNIVPSSGGDVVNASGTLSVNAQNANWDNWDSSDNSTQVWSCSDNTWSSCNCSGPLCSNFFTPTSSPSDADAVYLTTNTAKTPIDSTNGVQLSGSCK
jgi:hypothetical protein